MRRQRTARAHAGRYLGTGAAAVVAAVLLAGCGAGSSGGTGTTTAAKGKATVTATGEIQAARTDAGTVLVDPQGRTLYAFAADRKGHSACTGSCASYWPPTPGAALPKTAPAGVTATFGTIARPDGTMQLTVDGYPMYTYVGDSQPGQAKGQGLNESGGLWWVVSRSGSWITDSKPSAGTPADGGGYGY